jgi:flagellar assembly protein FliH
MSEPTRAVALSALTERRVGFAPDKRFVGGGRMEVSPLARRAHTPPAPVVEHVPEPEPENPVTRAFADGYAKGHAEDAAPPKQKPRSPMQRATGSKWR